MNNKILIYLGHPAQYHFFKNIIKLLKKEKVQVKIIIKTKDVLEDLLIADRHEYINILPKPRNLNKISILKNGIICTWTCSFQKCNGNDKVFRYCMDKSARISQILLDK